MAAQPYTSEDLKRGEELVQELRGLKGFDAWAEHLAKALAGERARAPQPTQDGWCT